MKKLAKLTHQNSNEQLQIDPVWNWIDANDSNEIEYMRGKWLQCQYILYCSKRNSWKNVHVHSLHSCEQSFCASVFIYIECVYLFICLVVCLFLTLQQRDCIVNEYQNLGSKKQNNRHSKFVSKAQDSRQKRYSFVRIWVSVCV